MITVRHIERLFDARQFLRLSRELMVTRAEGLAELEPTLGRAVPLAALAAIRMDELSQAHHPLYRRFLNVVLTSQEKDGGWGDPLTTSVCLRALLCGNGDGPAVQDGLAYLAGLQREEGIWPREPLRRMAADPLVSAFIVHQLGEFEAFRRVVRFDDAVHWFLDHGGELDAGTSRLWEHARMRCRLRPVATRCAPNVTLWTAPRSAA